MGLTYPELDKRTRAHMLAEFENDLVFGALYYSAWFSDIGRSAYPDHCREALESGTDDSLALRLSAAGIFVLEYQKRTPKGGITTARVPHTAPVTFAEGEFNRFYLRGLCLRLLEEGETGVEIWRAKEVDQPRSASVAMVGTVLEPGALLADLRASLGVDTALGLPPGPNSGLSGRRVTH